MSLKNSSHGKKIESDQKTVFPAAQDPDKIKLFEEILNSGTDLRVKVTGKSMSPFLRGGEILTIRKTSSSSLKTGDLVFFRDIEGNPILHRLIRKKQNKDATYTLQTKGDALISPDHPFREDVLIGKACKIEKISPGTGSKEINLESSAWRKINYLVAVAQIVKSHGYHLRGRLVMNIRSILQKVSGGSSGSIS